MKNTLNILWIALALVVVRPSLSLADWDDHDRDHRDGRHEHHEHHDRDYVGFNFSIWPDSYYYSAPYYPPSDTILVAPPVYQPVNINGTTYYVNNGNYYLYNGYQYQLVSPPVMGTVAPQQIIEPPPVSAAPADADDASEFTVNIPNDKGGYTPVTLKKSGGGYTGPQGEFYTEFPSVSKLKVMYGK